MSLIQTRRRILEPWKHAAVDDLGGSEHDLGALVLRHGAAASGTTWILSKQDVT